MTQTKCRSGAALLASTLLAGCAASGVTADHFVARGSAICSTTMQREQALGPAPRFSTPASRNLVAARMYLAHLVPILTDAAAQLRAVGAPDQRAATASAMIAKLDVAASEFRTAGAAVAHDDVMGFRNAFGAAVRADEDASGLDAELGLALCSQLATGPFRSTPGTPTPSPAPTAVASPT